MTKIQSKPRTNSVLILILFISLVLNGIFLLDRYIPASKIAIFNDPKSEVLNYIQNDYVGDRPSGDNLNKGELKGIVESLKDPYSEYLVKADAQNFQDEINERYQGIGVRFKMNNNKPQITKVLDGSPAKSAGLLENDVITKVGNDDVSGLSLDQIGSKVRGESGTSVNLTIQREGLQKSFDITRAPVQSELLSLEFKQNTAILSLTSFGNGLDEKMKNATQKIKDSQKECDQGNKDKCVNQVILDLRSNTGGLLDQAISVASYFVPGDSVVLKEKTRRETTTEKTGAKTPNLQDIPLKILVDKYTASSSEVVAAALREDRGAKLIGQKTFGKGVVQQLFQLKNGDTLKLTIAEWLTPQNNQINKVGLQPDVVVSEQDDALEIALKS